jgi:hypothetical protein
VFLFGIPGERARHRHSRLLSAVALCGSGSCKAEVPDALPSKGRVSCDCSWRGQATGVKPTSRVPRLQGSLAEEGVRHLTGEPATSSPWYAMSHGAEETARLKANIQDQLNRLLTQLQ